MEWKSVREGSQCLDGRAPLQALSPEPELLRFSDGAVMAMDVQASREAKQHVYSTL